MNLERVRMADEPPLHWAKSKQGCLRYMGAIRFILQSVVVFQRHEDRKVWSLCLFVFLCVLFCLTGEMEGRILKMKHEELTMKTV